jgi:hypothetical protein
VLTFHRSRRGMDACQQFVNVGRILEDVNKVVHSRTLI